MSDDFVRDLHDDLVEAMERYEQRRRPLRAPRPATLARVVVALAIAAAFLVSVRGLRPEPAPARPEVLARLAIGGEPVAAALAGGSLWVSDFTGSLVEVDPSERRITARVALPGEPDAVAVDGASLWVLRIGMARCESDLLRYDARSHRLAGSTRVPYATDGLGPGLAAGGAGVWVRTCAPAEHVVHVDQGGAVTARVPLANVDGLAAAGASVWAISRDGTVTQVDADRGRISGRWPQLAPLADASMSASAALVPDGAGAWVLSTGRAAIFRIERGRVVRRLAIDAPARPLLAEARDGIWFATADRNGADNRLIRLDPGSGKPTGTLELGHQRPIALIPSGGQLSVVTGDGTILFVGS